MRRATGTFVALIAAAVIGTAAAQNPPAGQPPGQPPTAQQPPPPQPGPAGPGGRGGPGGQRRGPIQIMTLTTTAWADGGTIPKKYTQAGEQVSPAFSWSNVPEGTQSFVLIAHDLDAATGTGTDDVLHWMLWNIPGESRSLPEGVPQAPQLPDGTRQISVSGPYYRGPGAPASGPPHHYVFELYALDGPINVPAVGQPPAQTRAAVVAAMATRVRGKGVYVGLFKR
jgi:Raf kinase inhibitor-like YbhB/YbcL family protein